jgi:hypothetical protein
MASEKRIAANRLNARKSCGPRTAAGKARVSRNALRHGLAALTHRAPLIFQDTEQMAKALCGTDDNPLLFEQALIIAENQVLLRCIRIERIAAIERLRDSAVIPLTQGDNGLAMAEATFAQAQLAWAEIDKMMAQYGFADYFHPPCDVLEDAPPGPEWRPARQERDDLAALLEATPDLNKLDRYERRAWSRRKRAQRKFIAIKVRSGGTRAAEYSQRVRGDGSATANLSADSKF